MWFYLMMTLLWFGSGHSFPKLESRHRNTYEIQEDKESNSLKFINPESDQPILREITYYHVVEKPYDVGSSIPVKANKEVVDTEDSSDEEVKTERPFTNGHGYEFIDYFPIVLNDTTKISDVDDLVEWIFSEKNDDESTDDSENTGDNDTDSEEEYYEDDATDTEDLEEDPNISKNVIVEVVTEKGKNIQKAQALTTEKSIDIPQQDKSTDSIEKEDMLDKEKVSTETTTKSRRHHQLFDSPEKLKERYQKMKNFVKVKEPSVYGQLTEKTNTRRKRSTRKEIPEAPILPELNYDDLPDYIKSVIFTEKPFENKDEHTKDGQNKHDKYREGIRRKMEEMFDTVAPNNSEGPGDKIIPLNNEEDGEVYMPTNNVRTYGMNLKEDGGYVWNNLLSNPGLKYRVGNLKPTEELNSFEENEEDTVIPTTTHKPPRPHKPHTTSKPLEPLESLEHIPLHIDIDIDSQEDMAETVNPDEAEENEYQIKYLNIEDDGVVNIPTNEVRTYGMNLTEDQGHVWNNMWSNPGLSYKVGNYETDEESKEIEANKEEYPILEETTTHKPRPHKPHTTPQPSVHEEYKPVHHDDSPKPDKEYPKPEPTTTHKPRPHKTHTTPQPSEHEENKPVHHDVSPKPDKDSDDIFVNLVDKDEYKKKPHQLQPLPKKMPEKEQKRQRTEIEDEKEKLIPMNKEDEDNDEDRIPEKLNDLLKNKKLWQWLSDWTETYMELLTEHIGTVVKEEISKHMANKVEEKEVEVEPLNDDNEKEEIQHYNSDVEKDKQEKESNGSKVELIEKQSEENDVNKDEIENIEKTTIFIDETEFPVTTSSNFDIDDELEDKKFFRNRKNKDDKKEVEIITDNEPRKEVKVIAQNIYGNSLESGKVTNMFFFFDQKRLKQVMDDIKPLLNEKNNSTAENVIIDNRIQEPSSTEEKEEKNLTEEKKPELIQISLDSEKSEETKKPASQHKPNLEEKKETNTSEEELEFNSEDKALETKNTENEAAGNTDIKEDKLETENSENEATEKTGIIEDKLEIENTENEAAKNTEIKEDKLETENTENEAAENTDVKEEKLKIENTQNTDIKKDKSTEIKITLK